MYSEEFDNSMSYNDEQYVDYDYQQEEQKPSFWNENKGLIIKIIIIVLCVLILIWLFLKVKGNNNNANSDNSVVVYNSNVDTIRLALEKYFFIDGNMSKDGSTTIVTLNELNKKGYIGDIVDANKKSCNINDSTGTLAKETDSYVLTINLTCGGMTTPKVYNYSLESNTCLNCTGFTYMDGINNNGSNNSQENGSSTDENGSDNQTSFEETLSCKVWSDWTDIKLNDDSLEVRTRVLIKGVKKGGKVEKITYGEWSEYTTSKIEATVNLEVETTVKQEEKWVSKTSTTPVKESDTIRNVKVTSTGGESYSYCPAGYKKENNACFKYSEIKTGDLTYIQYNTYKVLNKPCDGPYVVDGKTMIKNCRYQTFETKPLIWVNNSTTIYSYEQKTTKDVTYYRSRTKTIETNYEDDIYTGYILESELPKGYEKVKGSEKTEYSYRIKECEK